MFVTYTLVLVLVIGDAKTNAPIVTNISGFTSEVECQRALDNAGFVTPLPIYQNAGACEPVKNTSGK